MQTKIKICGLFRAEDIVAVNNVLPDFIGFVFAQSTRQVSIEQALKLRENLNQKIIPVGVFVNASIKTIREIVDQKIIDMVQLHGDEDEDFTVRGKVQFARCRHEDGGVDDGDGLVFFPVLVLFFQNQEGVSAGAAGIRALHEDQGFHFPVVIKVHEVVRVPSGFPVLFGNVESGNDGPANPIIGPHFGIQGAVGSMFFRCRFFFGAAAAGQNI